MPKLPKPNQYPSDYETLKKLWYNKLAKSKSDEYPEGFKDIEKNEYDLKVPYSKPQTQESLKSYKFKLEYYSMARRFLHDHKFSSIREKNIWTYHSEGISARETVKLFKKVRIKTNRMTIWRIVTRLQAIMKKMYMHE
jgi:superfamily II helicase